MAEYVVVGSVYFIGIYGGLHLHREVIWKVTAHSPREACILAMPQHEAIINQWATASGDFQFPRTYRKHGNRYHCYVHTYSPEDWAEIQRKRAEPKPERLSFRERHRSDCE